MKQATIKFINHVDNGCLVIGICMGLFAGGLTTITANDPIFILYGISGGLAFGLLTGIVRKINERY